MIRHNILARLFLVFAIALVVCGTGFAQSNGSIVGTITDVGGADVPGATITLQNINTGDSKTAQSNGGVDYQFL